MADVFNRTAEAYKGSFDNRVQTKVAGIKAHHSYVTDVCRINRGDSGAFQEVVRRLKEQYDLLTGQWPIGKGVQIHFVMTLDRPLVRSQLGAKDMSISYPPGDVAIPEIQRLVGMLTGSQPVSVKQAVKSGWIVQGYVAELTLGDPENAAAAGAVSLAEFKGELSDEDAVKVLQRLCNEGPTAQGLLDGVGGQALLKLLLPVLTRWISKWLEEGGLEDLIKKIGGSSSPSPAASPA